jgi:hypothetical protein
MIKRILSSMLRNIIEIESTEFKLRNSLCMCVRIMKKKRKLVDRQSRGYKLEFKQMINLIEMMLTNYLYFILDC